jgi:hypothetical protein
MMALLQAGLLAHQAWDASDVIDEGTYVAAAATLWANRDFHSNCEAPVLPKWAFAATMRLADPSIAATPRDHIAQARFLFYDRQAPDIRRLLLAARAATILATALSGLLLWAVASRIGRLTGFITHALWCFSPTVLANGSYATLDGWAAVLVVTVMWATARFIEKPSAGRAAVAGLCIAGALGTKVTTVLAVPVVVATGAIAAVRRGCGARALSAMAAVLFAGIVSGLFVLYAGTVGMVNVGDPCSFDPEAPTAVRLLGPLPFPAWIEGVWFQLNHGRVGHLNYLFGQVSTQGWWWFYLACLAFKTTVGAQGVALVGTASAAASPFRRRLDLALLAFPLLLLLAMSAGRHQPSISFLLPAFPPMLLWLGCSACSAARAWGDKGRVLVGVLLAAAVLESLAAHPYHLMFYNLWAGGSDGGPRYLVQRDDWGQDDRRLAAWQRREGVQRLYFTPYGGLWERWGIVADPAPCEPRAGIYALHAIEVHRPRTVAPGCLDWLTVEPPDERIGHAIYIYRVDDARIARLREKRDTSVPFWRSGHRMRTP